VHTSASINCIVYFLIEFGGILTYGNQLEIVLKY
jgi:hypothetical protein